MNGARSPITRKVWMGFALSRFDLTRIGTDHARGRVRAALENAGPGAEKEEYEWHLRFLDARGAFERGDYEGCRRQLVEIVKGAPPGFAAFIDELVTVLDEFVRAWNAAGAALAQGDREAARAHLERALAASNELSRTGPARARVERRRREAGVR